MNWRKSMRSQGVSNCVEAGEFTKSSYSGGGNCLEAGEFETVVLVRDTKEEHLGSGRTVLEFSPGAWVKFTDGLK